LPFNKYEILENWLFFSYFNNDVLFLYERYYANKVQYVC
jgi:hypothetical protein